jgi:hypothetical protein
MPNEIYILNKKTFAILVICCIIMGSTIGFSCGWLFEIVARSSCEVAMCRTREIDKITGSVIIVIMAGTAFCIALTFSYIQRITSDYVHTQKLPTWMQETIDNIRCRRRI